MWKVAISCVLLSVVQFECFARKESCSEALAKVEETLRNSPGISGLEKPRCHADGSYLGMQYRGSMAFCVTKDGTEITAYSVNRWETGPNMHCKCARDEYDYIQTRLFGKMFSCKPNGNYASIGCIGSVCFCQDTYGQQVGTSTAHIASQDSLNC